MKASPKGMLDFHAFEESLGPIFPWDYDKRKIVVPKPEEYLDFLPAEEDGPFKWEPPWEGEAYPSWDDDDQTFHKYDQSHGYERDEDGVVTITVEEWDGCDVEVCEVWASDGSEGDWEEMFRFHIGTWHQLDTVVMMLRYELWQLEQWCETGECPDPIENFIGDGPSWTQMCKSIRRYNEWAWRGWKELAGDRSPHSWED